MSKSVAAALLSALTLLLLTAEVAYSEQRYAPVFPTGTERSAESRLERESGDDEGRPGGSEGNGEVHHGGVQGCTFHGASSLGSIAQQISNVSGDPMFDQLMANELNFMTQLFGVRPRFLYMLESGGGNAYATSEVMDPSMMHQFPDGTILFGLKLIQGEQMSMQASLPGILAHEMAHILQNKIGSPLQGKARELQADYLAGWYLAKRQMFAWTDVRGTFRAMFQRGDYAFNTAEHHGTPEQRLLAIASGFQDVTPNTLMAYQNAALLASNL